MTWQVDLRPRADGTVHVWPNDDVIIHDLNGHRCICGPRTDDGAPRGRMIVHASLDGRELVE